MTHLNVSDITDLARNVADTGGFCLCLAIDSKGDTWRLAVLPGNTHPYAVQIQHTWKENGRLCHAWHEWDGFVLLVDAASAFCALVGNKIEQMSEM